ncbi:hypothetical protein [Dactylosporangium matsuzakiense]|uniref:Uncharacterized protein n=1 Tax=Dactylosporangium matsuzakiense TaxID=53360 RepID=A0A9W6NNE9_9ACTN|nr:hypothetical protein [Dactylosporangium matsuzakiense]UWZ44186.1 hypothetical protein Dmats_43520 [Dactylosporangium matsuzakiense]GLL03374.1 hypothetical protein GCM10017581_051190 [Dactylosporangium matsuzakiense]
MSDYSAVGGVESYEWNRRDSARYDAAQEAIEEAIACYTRLHNRAVTSGNTAEAERLRSEQYACVTEQKLLRPGDAVAVDRVLGEYPALISWLRDRIG